MSDQDSAARTLAQIQAVIEYRLGQPVTEFRSVAHALDALLLHEARAGTIPHRGWRWFSDEDYQRLREAAYTPWTSRAVVHPLIRHAMVAIERCQTGEDFTHLMAEMLLQTSAELNRLQKMAIDGAALQPKPMYFPLPGAEKL